MNGYDKLHNIPLGVVLKVLESVRKTLSMVRGQHDTAAAWQIGYLQYARTHARFSGFRIFASIDTKRNFDDNNSFLTLLPLLFPSFLFRKCTSILDMEGPTEVLMALTTFVQLTFPAQPQGFSEMQLEMLQQAATKYVVILHTLICPVASSRCIARTALHVTRMSLITAM